MLILSRKKEEVIKIGDNIEIKILKIKGKTVTIGIKCPRSIPVHRSEVVNSNT